jgi:hypothetical protein
MPERQKNNNSGKVLKLPTKRLGVHESQFTPGPMELINGKMRQTFTIPWKQSAEKYISIPHNEASEFVKKMKESSEQT